MICYIYGVFCNKWLQYGELVRGIFASLLNNSVINGVFVTKTISLGLLWEAIAFLLRKL